MPSSNSSQPASTYIGRFAPSPSGPLHMGSLVAALGSYLQAKQQQGQWLLRIEDIDPPREQAGSDTLIMETLLAHGLSWDQEVTYQSQNSQNYLSVLQKLLDSNQAYYCQCTRKQIKQSGGYYAGTCRELRLSAKGHSLRLLNQEPLTEFWDELHGLVKINHKLAQEDFIIHRKDGLFAYNLAVVVDDREQGITQIVRGSDLIEPSVRQLTLWNKLNQIGTYKTLPTYMHLPLVMDKNGNKLSKQNHAPAIDNAQAAKNLISALAYLHQPVPSTLLNASVADIIEWAIEHWEAPKHSRMRQ